MIEVMNYKSRLGIYVYFILSPHYHSNLTQANGIYIVE